MKKLFIALAAATLLIAAATAKSSKTDITGNLKVFNELYKTLNTFYVDTIDAEEAVTTAIVSMLDEIDPYTEYIPAKYADNLETMTTGEYGGIGSYIMERNGDVYFSEPNLGSPAQRGGIRAGDRIVVIDGDTVLKTPSAEVSRRLKGTPGTNVSVTVWRPDVGADSVITFNLRREKIQQKSVSWSGVRDSIGYIKLSQYIDKSPDEVREALTEIVKTPGLKGVVLDLRGNGGGLVESAVKILGYFLPKGTEVLKMRGKGHLSDRIYKTSVNPIDTKIPLAILIDNSTASASEITAGAIQDLDRGVIVGERSFGKGLVQSIFDLPDENQVKITIAKYYIPSGRLIQALDYAHRNPDGTPSHVPDSLSNIFRTKAGREVRDGGGITPDVTVESPEGNRLLFNIVRDLWAFDFATRYRAAHDTIVAPGEFRVTDEMFDEFKKSIDPEKFEYDLTTETMLASLRRAAEVEGYDTDSLKPYFDQLESVLRHDLDRDLDRNRAMINQLLGAEIVSRYYYQPGKAEYYTLDDPQLERAIEILGNPAEYRSLLSPKKKK